MGSRFTKKKPEFVYFWGSGEWLNGPYMNPQKGRDCVKYRLVPADEEITPENIVKAQKELIQILESQVVDLTMMSKIELGDDVIEAINHLKKVIENKNEKV